MKYLNPVFIVLIFLAGSQASAQDVVDIDPLVFSPNYFDDLEEAKKNPDEVFYLDLSLYDPKFTTIPSEIYELKNLQRLNLSFNRIARVDAEVGNLTNLEVFSLQGNHYLTFISEEIAKCKKLKELNIHTTGMSKAAVEKISKLLPEGCEFITPK